MNIEHYISLFLADKQSLVTPDDSVSVVEGQITRWDFKNIPRPSLEELEAFAPAVEAEQEKAQAQKFLADTDWKVLRHRDQQDMGLATSLSGEEFQELLRERQMARDAIVK